MTSHGVETGYAPGAGLSATCAVVAGALQREATKTEHGDQHLHSIRETTGYTIQELGDDIGHVDHFIVDHFIVDHFIVDDGTWAINYIVVDTQNWWPGKHVLISPRSRRPGAAASAVSQWEPEINRVP